MSTIYGNQLNSELWWSDFEKMLAEIDYNHLVKSYNGEAIGALKVENLLKYTLPSLFKRWINDINVIVKKYDSLKIDQEAHFFTFNYTLLLEQTYHVKEEYVWHIHNSIKDKNDSIIVGHDSNQSTLFKLLQSYNKHHLGTHIRPDIQELINQGIAKGAKKVKDRIELNKDKFYNYNKIKHFIVMGFSFNDIDMPYIKRSIEVNQDIANADWELYWHSNGKDEAMKRKLIGLGVNANNISCTNW